MLKKADGAAEASRIREYVRGRFASLNRVWSPLNESTIDGLCEWLSVDTSQEMSDLVVDIATKTLASTQQGIASSERVRLASKMDHLGIFPVGEGDKKPWTVHMDASEWLELDHHRSEQAPSTLMKPDCPSDSVVALLCGHAKLTETQTITLSRSHVTALRNLMAVKSNVDADELVDTLLFTVRSSANVTVQAHVQTVAECLARLHELRLIGIQAADKALLTDDCADAILRTLSHASAGTSEDSTLLASLIHACPNLDLSEGWPNVADHVKAQVTKLRANGNLARTKNVWTQLQQFQCVGIISRLVGTSANGLMTDLIEHSANTNSVAFAITPEFVMLNAHWLRRTLEKRKTNIEDIVSALESNGAAIAHLKETGILTDKKTRQAIHLFLDYASKEATADLTRWANERISGLPTEDWIADLREGANLAKLAAKLIEPGGSPTVSAAFKNALLRLIPDFLKADVSIAADGLKSLVKLIQNLPPDIGTELGTQSLISLRDSNRGLTDQVATVFGNIMLQAGVELSQDELAFLIARTIPSGSVIALQWCADAAGQIDGIPTELSNEPRNLLQEEIESALAEQTEEATTSFFERLKYSFGLTPASGEDEDENGSSKTNEDEDTNRT